MFSTNALLLINKFYVLLDFYAGIEYDKDYMSDDSYLGIIKLSMNTSRILKMSSQADLFI